MKVAIVLNCGSPITRKISADKIICCDGGYRLCPVEPDIVLGDFDSLDKAEVTVPVVEHNPHKNASDGELAVYYAKETFAADEIVFYGVLGGRFDHMLCNLAVMKLAANLGMKVKAEEDGLNIHYATAGKFELATQKGETVSVLPYGGNALVAHSQNLEYPLENLLLTVSDSRGVSNVSLGGKIALEIASGAVFVFRYLNR